MPRLPRPAFVLAPLLALLAALVAAFAGPAVLLLKQALFTGRAETGLLIWLYVFTLGLPMWIVTAALLGQWMRRHSFGQTVPSAGVKIPRKGQ